MEHLAHEVRDDPVELAALEVQLLPRPPHARLPGAQRPEVLGCPWHHIGGKPDHHPADGLAPDVKLEEHACILIRAVHAATSTAAYL